MSLRLDCQAVTAHWLTLSGPSELIIFSTSLIFLVFCVFSGFFSVWSWPRGFSLQIGPRNAHKNVDQSEGAKFFVWWVTDFASDFELKIREPDILEKNISFLCYFKSNQLHIIFFKKSSKNRAKTSFFLRSNFLIAVVLNKRQLFLTKLRQIRDFITLYFLHLSLVFIQGVK